MPSSSASVRPWALVSSAGALLALIGCSVLAGALQPAGYDPVQQTISTLASRGATHREIMTIGLYAVGACHLLTAAGLRRLPVQGRLVLAFGGLTGLGVATFAQPASGTSAPHMIFATAGAVTMAVWPATMASRSPSAPWTVRPGMSLAASTAMGILLSWVLWEAQYGSALGVAERVTTLVQTAWPLLVVVSSRHASTAEVAMPAGYEIGVER